MHCSNAYTYRILSSHYESVTYMNEEYIMNKADKKLRDALLPLYEADMKAFNEEMKALDEEMKDLPPHKFSMKFEAKMAVMLGEFKTEFQFVRENSGMNQTEFAKYFNIPLRTVQHWEAGSRKPPEYVLDLIRYKLENEKKVEE